MSFVQVYDGRGNRTTPKPYPFTIQSAHVDFHRGQDFNTRPGYKPDLIGVDRYMTVLFDIEKSLDLVSETLSKLEDVIRERHVFETLTVQAKWAGFTVAYQYTSVLLHIARRPRSYAARNVLELAFVFNETNEDAIDRWDGLT